MRPGSRHVSSILQDAGLDGRAKGADVPWKTCEAVSDKEELNPQETTAFRGTAARLSYLVQGRPDVRFSALSACRSLAVPTRGTHLEIKRCARYLSRFPECEQLMPWGYGGAARLEAWTDAGWASDAATRKYGSGGIPSLAGVTVKTWSRCQSCIALSSGESEVHAATMAASEAR